MAVFWPSPHRPRPPPWSSATARFPVRGHGRGLPGRGEGIELDGVDRLRRIVPAIDRPLDDIAQLADIAGPGIGDQPRHALSAKNRAARPAHFGRHAPAEMLDQHFDIAFAAAQGRQGDDVEAEAIEQVGAEWPASTASGRCSLVAATMRTSTLSGRELPMRVTSPYSTARSRRSCAAMESVPSSSRNNVPPSASSKRPARALVAPVERAGLMAEQLGLDQRPRAAPHSSSR